MVRKVILMVGFIGLLIALSNAMEIVKEKYDAGSEEMETVEVKYDAESEDGKKKANVRAVLKTNDEGIFYYKSTEPETNFVREEEEKKITCPENAKMLCHYQDQGGLFEQIHCVDGKDFKEPNQEAPAIFYPNPSEEFAHLMQCKEAKHKIKPELFDFLADLESKPESKWSSIEEANLKTTPVYCKLQLESKSTPQYYAPKEGHDQAALIKHLKKIHFKNVTINDKVKYKYIVCEEFLSKWDKYGKWIILIVVVLIIGGVIYWFLFCDEDDDDEGNYNEDEEQAPSP